MRQDGPRFCAEFIEQEAAYLADRVRDAMDEIRAFAPPGINPRNVVNSGEPDPKDIMGASARAFAHAGPAFKETPPPRLDMPARAGGGTDAPQGHRRQMAEPGAQDIEGDRVTALFKHQHAMQRAKAVDGMKLWAKLQDQLEGHRADDNEEPEPGDRMVEPMFEDIRKKLALRRCGDPAR